MSAHSGGDHDGKITDAGISFRTEKGQFATFQTFILESFGNCVGGLEFEKDISQGKGMTIE